MNKNDFTGYLSRPENIRNSKAGELTFLLEKFPYFQSAIFGICGLSQQSG